MVKVSAFTGGLNEPSARFRVRQYIHHLRSYGVEVKDFAATWSSYPPVNRVIRPFWALGTLSARMPGIACSHRYNVTLLQREMLSTFLTLEPLTRRPRILDVDDAIWLHRRGGFARRLAGICEAVICGNDFLAGEFSRWNNNIKVLPTAVDTDRYFPVKNIADEKLIIGWSGTSSGFSFLYGIEGALSAILKKHAGVRLRIVADRRPDFRVIPPGQLEFIKWAPDNEVSALQDMTIGIMPLEDSLWSRGKCSYKMLTYMACGLPVVVSPVGMNTEVLALAEIGYGPTQEDQWVEALDWLLLNREKGREMGLAGREIVEKKYSLLNLAPQLADILIQFGR